LSNYFIKLNLAENKKMLINNKRFIILIGIIMEYLKYFDLNKRIRQLISAPIIY
jgi:hypothetical protein